MIGDVEIVEDQRRAYGADEIAKRKHNEPRWRNFGARTTMGTISEIKTVKNVSLFTRLSKIHVSLVNSIERNLWEAKPKLADIGQRIGLPEFVRETAWRIYEEVAKQKLTMGRTIEGFVAASIYVAVRVHEIPIMLDEIVDASKSNLRSIHKLLGMIVRNVLPMMKMRYKPISPESVVFRIGQIMNIPFPVQQEAIKVIKKARVLHIPCIGRDPKGVAAASLYMVVKQTDQKLTQVNVASVANITEVTLRTNCKMMQQCLP